MESEAILRLTSEALMLCLVLSLPAVLTSAVLGLLVAFLQAVLSLQDQSLSHGIKLLAVTAAVFLSAPWAGAALVRFSESLFSAILTN